MNKLQVSSAKYLSEVLENLPHNCLFDKGMTGCGGTFLAITSKHPYVICVPFTSLVRNKTSQHDNVFGVYSGVTQEAITRYLSKTDCPKIMVTYDSLPKVIDCIDPSRFNLLVDELHVMFLHYSFRSEAVHSVLRNFDKFKSYCFMTATPLEDDFMLDELKHLPKVEAVWDTVKEVSVNSVKCKNDVRGTVVASIEKFLKGFVEGNAYYFVNSVEFIKDMVKICNLTDENCRVIYSESNRTKIGINRGNTYDAPKKINFITSTAFEGCDIYDENGRIIIISDNKRPQTLTDISTSFQQIAGRIRNTKYWNDITHIFTQTRYYTDLTYPEFKQASDIQVDRVDRYVEQLMGLDKELRVRVTIGLDTYVTKNDDIFSFDPNLVKIDLYNFKICKCLYKLRVNVVEALRAEDYNVKIYDRADTCPEVLDSTTDLNFKGTVMELEANQDNLAIRKDAFNRYPFLEKALEVLGLEGIKSSGYVATNIKRKLIQSTSMTPTTKVAKMLKLNSKFNQGNFIPSKYAKEAISNIYKTLNITKTPNIKDFYEVKDHVRRVDGKVTSGYIIIMPKIVL